MQEIAKMMEKRKKQQDLSRTTELYDMCDNVIANVKKIQKQSLEIRDSEIRETVDVKSTVNISSSKEKYITLEKDKPKPQHFSVQEYNEIDTTHKGLSAAQQPSVKNKKEQQLTLQKKEIKK